eukprot:2353555-Rhodomonas_salina.2
MSGAELAYGATRPSKYTAVLQVCLLSPFVPDTTLSYATTSVSPHAPSKLSATLPLRCIAMLSLAPRYLPMDLLFYLLMHSHRPSPNTFALPISLRRANPIADLERGQSVWARGQEFSLSRRKIPSNSRQVPLWAYARAGPCPVLTYGVCRGTRV